MYREPVSLTEIKREQEGLQTLAMTTLEVVKSCEHLGYQIESSIYGARQSEERKETPINCLMDALQVIRNTAMSINNILLEINKSL